MSILKYADLKKMLKNEGFTDKQADQSIRALRRMDKELKHSFWMWFESGVLPDVRLGCSENGEDGFSVRELVEKLHMGKVQAFLFGDWLKKDPIKAKKALLTPNDAIYGIPEEEIVDESDIPID